MITADQARANYNPTFIQRDHFIKNIVEPAILEASKMAHEIKIEAVNSYCAKTSIYFSKYSKEDYDYQYDGYNVELTEAIVNELKENGYKVYESIGSGTEFHNTYGYFVVSWSE